MPVVPPLETDHYLLYQERAEYMRAVEEAAPHLVRLFSIGTSHEGRPLLLAEVTNRATGEGLEKPALWLDGNLQGAELAGSSACLEVLRQLASGYGRDATVTGLLDRCTFYIVPRLSPDGAEHCLTTGELVRSGTRPYPTEDSRPGLSPCDINGDGRILQMRVEDPLGEWKVSKRDPRLLVRRAPDDVQGPFYRLYREGLVEGEDGPLHVPAPRCQLDFDCNFPCDWLPEEEQPGAGPYPLSEPETRAVVDFFRTHPNLCVAISCHSLRGAVVRPYAARSDTELGGADTALYREFGRRVEELCGYPLVSALVSAGGRKSHGSFLDWAYQHCGVLSFSPQMWCLGRAAGLEVPDPLQFLEERSEPENVGLLRWLDRELQGHGFLPWTGFEHPQLGYVEIGGWDVLNAWLNPPPGAYLRDEVDRCSRLVLGLAGALPRVAVTGCREEVVGWSDTVPLRKVVLEYENQGYLPTWVTGVALERKLAGSLEVRCSTDAETELLLGPAFQQGGQLAGTGTVHVDGSQDSVFFQGASERQRARLEWLVRGEGVVQIELRHDRAGSVLVASRLERAVPAMPEARPTRAPAAAPTPLAPPPPPPPARPMPAAATPAARPAPPAPAPRPATRPAAALPQAPARPVPASAAAPRPLPTPPPAPTPAAPVRPVAPVAAPRPAPPAMTAPAVAAASLGPGLAAPVAQMMAAEAAPPPLPPRPLEPPAAPVPVNPASPAPKGRVLGSPPARPGANFATQAQEMVAARRENAGPGDILKPAALPAVPPAAQQQGDAFSPGLVLRPAYPQKGAPGRPAEPPPSSIPPEVDAPPEAPAAESRLPALFLRQRRKEK